jgi:hypothetical protein
MSTLVQRDRLQATNAVLLEVNSQPELLVVIAVFAVLAYYLWHVLPSDRYVLFAGLCQLQKSLVGDLFTTV